MGKLQNVTKIEKKSNLGKRQNKNFVGRDFSIFTAKIIAKLDVARS